MTLHKKYSSFEVPCHCPQSFSGFLPAKWDSAPPLGFEREGVLSLCHCGESITAFYRLPDREKERIAIDKAAIGQTVTVDRIIAWVGYAKNPTTIHLSAQMINDKMEQLWAQETSGNEMRGINWRLEKALRQWARYELRKEEMNKVPILRDRAFWFQDRSVTATIEQVATCYTGRQSPAQTDPGYWGDGYEPAYLCGATYHRVYCALTDDHRPVMIHPSDLLQN